MQISSVRGRAHADNCPFDGSFGGGNDHFGHCISRGRTLYVPTGYQIIGLYVLKIIKYLLTK